MQSASPELAKMGVSYCPHELVLAEGCNARVCLISESTLHLPALQSFPVFFAAEESTYTSINFTCEDLVKKEHMDFKRNLTRPLSGIRMFFCESMKLNSPRHVNTVLFLGR